MKILMQNRKDSFKNFGGDTLQMLKTKEYLEKAGIKVEINLDFSVSLRKYDLVHLFNITRIEGTYLQYKNARKYGIPIVVSPIYHSQNFLLRYYKEGMNGFPRYMFKILRKNHRYQTLKVVYSVMKDIRQIKSLAVLFLKGYTNEQIEILNNADCCLPNSELEARSIRENFALSKFNYEIIPNGVETESEVFSINENDFVNTFKVKEFIFFPARIEPLKNQINLIKSLMNDNIPIVFAGNLSKKHCKYVKKFLLLVKKRKNTLWIGHLSRKILFSGYAAAKVVVLPSWFETTGLVGLEGGIKDCNVVITNRGYAKEYFRDFVWYCDPDSLSSIRKAVLSAYYSPRGDKCLKQHIESLDLSWKRAAKKTLKVYKKLLGINNEFIYHNSKL